MKRSELEPSAEKLLSLIRHRRNTFISIKGLARKLDLLPDDIKTAVSTLSSWGYRVRTRKDHVVFMGAPDSLIDTEIKHKLKTECLGHQVHSYRSVKSTNDIAIALAENGAPEGTIVTAEEQTRGRGRFGRSWHSEPGNGIYMSLILRPKFRPEKAPALSLLTAAALADTISHYLPGRVRIKWPNDVLIGRKRLRKTAGILTELSAEHNRINHVIIGVGININHTVNDFPENIRHIATSVRRALRKKVHRVDLLKMFLHKLEKEYTGYQKHGLSKTLPRIRRYSSLIGRTIKLASGKQITEGRVVDIDPDGRLVLDIDGTLRNVIAGEVTVVKD